MQGITIITAGFLTLFFTGTLFPVVAKGQVTPDTMASPGYIKKEISTGMVIHLKNDRDELITDISREKEEMLSGSGSFLFKGQVWNFLERRQEIMDLSVQAGLFAGEGTRNDSTSLFMMDAEQKNYGLRIDLGGNYDTRFYYDRNNYTLIRVSGWLKNDFYQQNTSGTKTDSNKVTVPVKEEDFTHRYRYGFHAKAGWGFGRLDPVNHRMVAEYLLNNFYEGRVFSEQEIERVAVAIGEIKHRRDPGISHSAEKELEILKDYLRSALLLEAPATDSELWELGEFYPRFEGTRFELGPSFTYNNREPDFYYGAFMQFDNEKYINTAWNRLLSAKLQYSHYKKREWATLETRLGWTYYVGLKSQVGFGLSYIPGVIIHALDDFEPVRHNFIPYFEYFTQLNAKSRVSLSFAWNIGDGDEFMMSGPELSLLIYRSRY